MPRTAHVQGRWRLAALSIVLLLSLPSARAQIPPKAGQPLPAFQPFRLPESARPLEAHMTLRVNGEVGIPSPVTVDAGRTAEVSWDVSAVSGRPTGIWLRVRRDAELACSDELAEPGDVISRLEDRVAGSATIRLPEIGLFHVMACMVQTDGTAPRGARYTGDWTNVVPVQHGRMSSVVVVEPPTFVADPDLVVSGAVPIRRGPNRGQLVVVVAAQPAAPGAPIPPGNFPYRVYVVPSEVAARHRRQDTVSTWRETRRYDGTGRVRDLGFGHGDVITMPIRVADDQAYTVFLVVNPRYDPFAGAELLPPTPPAPDPYYRERNYRNNHYVMTVDLDPGRLGRRPPADDVLDLWIESQGPGWALVGARYTLWSGDEGQLSLTLHGAEVPGYPGPAHPLPGRGPTLDQLRDARGLEIACVSAESAAPQVDAFSGLNQTARFLCRHRGPGIALLDWVLPLRLMDASPGIDEARRREDPLLREISVRLGGMEYGAEVRLEPRASASVEKRFGFRAAFLGGGAPSLPPLLALAPVQVATGRVTDFWRDGFCFGAVGTAWPADFTVPIGSQALVAFRRDYVSGADPFPCHSQWTFIADGLVRFDLGPFVPADAARLTRATLSLPSPTPLAGNACPAPAAPSVQAAVPGYEDRSGAFAFFTGASRRLSLGVGPVLVPTSAEPGRLAVDATALVRDWLSGVRNSGFRLAQPPGGADRTDWSCAGFYGDFRLTLEFPPP